MQELNRVQEQCEARLAAQSEAHSAQVAALHDQLSEARAQAAGSAEQAHAVAKDVAALKAALAVVQEEQRVRLLVPVIRARPATLAVGGSGTAGICRCALRVASSHRSR